MDRHRGADLQAERMHGSGLEDAEFLRVRDRGNHCNGSTPEVGSNDRGGRDGSNKHQQGVCRAPLRSGEPREIFKPFLGICGRTFTMMNSKATTRMISTKVRFNPVQAMEILGISEHHVPVMMLAVGSRAPGNNARRPRLPVDHVLTFNISPV